MKTGWKSLAWSAAALLLLLTIATPLNVVTAFLVMTPFVVLFMMHTPAGFAAHFIPIAIAAFFLSGGYGPIVLTLAFFFLVPALAMGYFYKKGAPARTAVITGFIVILVQLLLELVLFSVLFDVDLSSELSGLLITNLTQMETANLVPAGWAAETAEAVSDAIVTMLPTLLLLSAFLFTVINHGISRRALRTVGIQVPGLPEAKTWRLPTNLILYYLIALIASFFIDEEQGGYWVVVIANLVPILRFAFTVQGIGFMFFLADAKGWPKAVAVLLSVPLILFPPLYIIGLLDAAFPLRRYFVKS